MPAKILGSGFRWCIASPFLAGLGGSEVDSPPPVILCKVFKIEYLGPDLRCKILILKETFFKVFQRWDLAAD